MERVEPVWERDVPRKLSDPRDASPAREVDLTAAQRETNFVVFSPAWVPDDCRVRTTTLRPEMPPGRLGLSAEALSQSPHSENNACSLRTEIAGAGRCLRIKQFLYDWAPPTAGSATLWKTPWLEPLHGGGSMGWMGVDFKGNVGACIQLARTQIELSVLAGTFDRDELERIVEHLKESDARGALAVKRTPFHVLSYHVRFRQRGMGVPYGLHRYEEPRRYDVAEIVASDSTAFSTLPSTVASAAGLDFRHDSSIHMHDAASAHVEDETLLRDAANGSDHLWCSCISNGTFDASAGPLDLYDEHPCAFAEARRVATTEVRFATLDERYGGHEAFWSDGTRRFAVWTSPSPRLDYRAFRSVIAAFIETSASGFDEAAR